MVGEQPDLSIVVPARNESHRLGATLDRMIDYLTGRWSYEIIVVDDGSDDGTSEYAASFIPRVSPPNSLQVVRLEASGGKGAAVRRGMLVARGRYRFFSDADLSTPIEELEAFLPLLESEYDVVFGSRAMAASQLEKRQGLLREEMGRTFNRILRVFRLVPFHDTQCGFKGFRAEAARQLFRQQTIDGFAFDVEILVMALRAGMRLKEQPVRWINDEESKVHILTSPLRMFWDVLRIRWRLWWKG